MRTTSRSSGVSPLEWSQDPVSQIHPPIVPTMSTVRQGPAEKSELLLWKWFIDRFDEEGGIKFHPCYALIKLHQLCLVLIQLEETGEMFWVDPTELLPTEPVHDTGSSSLYRDGVDFSNDPGTPPDLR